MPYIGGGVSDLLDGFSIGVLISRLRGQPKFVVCVKPWFGSRGRTWKQRFDTVDEAISQAQKAADDITAGRWLP